ncbi:MAG: hypothetical protein IPG04_40670 [Polyangiaceae bacterium]|nr:hypothetical protein [Polyangiaceae bacterium]
MPGRVAERAFHDAESRAAFAGSQLAAAIVEVLESASSASMTWVPAHDVALALDSSGLATVSAMHAYVRDPSPWRASGKASVSSTSGGGSGCGAALLRRLVGEQGKVVTVEVDPAHAATAASLLPERRDR